MSDGTKIEWTDATWNPITGCSVHSPGCTNCYAMKLAGTRLKHVASRKGLTRETKTGPVWTGEVRFNETELLKPLSWRRPRMIFVCAHGDLFHESVPDEWIDQVFAVMALCPQHTFQVLTKRSARMREYVTALIDGRRGVLCAMSDLGAPSVMANADALWGPDDANRRRPLPNLWLGVSVEDQTRADERVPDLLATPAAVRWLSCEPLLGPVDLRSSLYRGEGGITMRGYLRDKSEPDDFHYWASKVDWIVAGGESGPGARPMHPDWARSLRDQCSAAGVPFFFKQWGEYTPLRADLIPTPRERQAWVHVDGKMVVRVRVEADIRAMTREEDRVGRPLYGHMLQVGKARAGRLLDGQLHDAMPAR